MFVWKWVFPDHPRAVLVDDFIEGFIPLTKRANSGHDVLHHFLVLGIGPDIEQGANVLGIDSGDRYYRFYSLFSC